MPKVKKRVKKIGPDRFFHSEIFELLYPCLRFIVLVFQAMVDELCNGACVAMEITKDESVPSTFREFVGPSDPVCRNVLGNVNQGLHYA